MYFLGLDIGSAFSKAVVCEDTTIKAFAVAPSGGSYRETAANLRDEALERVRLSPHDLSNLVATGYGASAVEWVDRSATDISCQARAISALFPEAATVIDIGGQFSKVIRIGAGGKPAGFVLNETCAAGSGKFLQVISRLLHVPIDAIGELSLNSANPVEFTTGCAVFAEAEVISRVAEGARIEDILAGVHNAMASKIVNLVERTGATVTCVVVTGGGAKDVGLVKAIEAALAIPLLVPPEPQITAAYGAALIAAVHA